MAELRPCAALYISDVERQVLNGRDRPVRVESRLARHIETGSLGSASNRTVVSVPRPQQLEQH
jgi:hypothetical protein